MIINTDHKIKIGYKTTSEFLGTEIGGLSARAIITASELGADCSFRCYLGKNENSKNTLKFLSKYGIDARAVEIVDHVEPILSISVVDKNKDDRTVFYDTSKWHYNIKNEFKNLENLKNAEAIIIDDYINIKTLYKIFEISSRFKIPIVADFENLELQKSKCLFNMVQHLIISKKFAQNFSGVADVKKIINDLWNDKKCLVGITDGENGCYYRSLDSNEIQHQAAYIQNTKNTLGCGDVFHGAYAFSLFKYEDFSSRIKFASAAASLKASGKKVNIRNIDKLLKIFEN